MRKVSFKSDGTKIVADLYIPEGLSGTAPALPILGPMTFVKEQAPTEYAKRLAERGYVALAFDPRYHGESAGEPRRWENPRAKVADARAAVDYLTTLPEVDAGRIAALAICQGSSEMIRAAADDERIRVLATVAGQYRDREGDVEWLKEEELAIRLTRGERAKAKYETSGEVEYVPAVDPERTDVGMPGKMVWDWYHKWAERGVWENRYAVMSDADLLSYESRTAAERLRKPYLMIHSDECFLPAVARRHFELVPGADKKLLWENPNQHFQYYDDPAVIDKAVESIDGWFEQHLR
ncbi:MAG TPA: CocE/NonD family hydrolase [Pyrinomonadaceae bacterium]